MSKDAAAAGLRGPAMLFCPADRPDRYHKALAAADTVIIDLEDAVASVNRSAARDALVRTPLDPERVVVRVNPANTADHSADLDAVRSTDYRILMLAKSETPDDLAALQDWDVIPLCETPSGVLNATRLAAMPNVVALIWGAEDLLAALGGRSSRLASGRYRDLARYARATVQLAAAAAGRPAIDSVFLDIADLDGLSAEAEDAANTGFACKACIHPAQVPLVRAAFRPTAEQVAHAQRIIEASLGHGVVTVGGQMIDAPLIMQARAVLAAATAGHPPAQREAAADGSHADQAASNTRRPTTRESG